VDLLLHVEQLFTLLLLDRRHRYAGPPGNYFQHLVAGDFQLILAALLPAFLETTQVLLQSEFLFAESGSGFKILFRNGFLHLFDGLADPPFHLAHIH